MTGAHIVTAFFVVGILLVLIPAVIWSYQSVGPMAGVATVGFALMLAAAIGVHLVSWTK